MELQETCTMTENEKGCPHKADILNSGKEKEVEPCKKATVLNGFPEKWEEAITRLKRSGMDLDRIKLAMKEK